MPMTDSNQSSAGVPSGESVTRRWKLGGLGVLGVLIVAGASYALIRTTTGDEDERLTHTITRGGLVVSVVEQGALESSNSDPVRTMTSLIEASRYFDAMQKLLQAADEMTQRANRSAGGSS